MRFYCDELLLREACGSAWELHIFMNSEFKFYLDGLGFGGRFAWFVVGGVWCIVLCCVLVCSAAGTK